MFFHIKKLITAKQRKFILIFLDIIVIFFTLILAILLRYHPLTAAQAAIINYWWLIPIFIAIKIGTFQNYGMYSFIWRYASVKELLSVVKAISISSIFILAFLFFTQSATIPIRSLVFIDWSLSLVFIGALRILLRITKDHLVDLQYLFPFFKVKENKKNILIIGAGDAGEIVAREILRVSYTKYNIVGFVDDEKNKLGQHIHQIPILGTIAAIPYLTIQHNIQEAIIAIPSASGSVIRKIIDICEELDLQFKTTPKLYDLIDGKISISQLRDVRIEDLLGRSVIKTNMKVVSQYLKNATVLITGAGGSIGSELCRQIFAIKPRQIILADHSENNIYQIDMELKSLQSTSHKVEIIPLVIDVKNKDKLRCIFAQYKPNVIFHAAAYKHVPLMEYNVEEVVQNNVLGTKNLLSLASEFKIKEFVLISTDKAVRPANCMGSTKRLCEVLLQIESAKSPQTKFTAVRFGNVLGSVGSVVPLFKKQIKKGGPITVTDPEMTRYFMTIPEAVSLVIQAGALCENSGEIFILDMGDPIKIVDLAKDMIKLSGLEIGKDIEIKFVGTRPGEKLDEELFYDKKELKQTEHEKIFITKPQTFDQQKETKSITTLLNECYQISTADLKKHLMTLANSFF